MREIKASEFKAKCLALLDEVAASGEPLIVTKHGRPMARLVPVGTPAKFVFGALKHMTHIVDPDDDLNSALSEDEVAAWSASLQRKARGSTGRGKA